MKLWLTSNDNIQNQNNESDYTTTATVFPCIAMSSGRDGLLGESEGEQGKLQEESEGGLHDYSAC